MRFLKLFFQATSPGPERDAWDQPRILSNIREVINDSRGQNILAKTTHIFLLLKLRKRHSGLPRYLSLFKLLYIILLKHKNYVYG